MRLIFAIGFAFFTTFSFAQEIKWMTFEDAQKAQKKVPKKIFVDAYTVWCGPCKMLDKNTFSNKDVASYINKNYYPVKFNAEGNAIVYYKGKKYTNPNFNSSSTGRNSPHELSGLLGIRAYPTLLFLDEEANVISPLTGYRTPTQLEIFLKMFNTDAHKNLTTQAAWEDYSSKFKYEFKD